MQFLRNARLFRRLALVWLGLALGVAIAAPLANPTSMEVICSTSGVTIVSLDGRAPSGDTSELHCPFCFGIMQAINCGLPFAAACSFAEFVQPLLTLINNGKKQLRPILDAGQANPVFLRLSARALDANALFSGPAFALLR